MMYTAAMIIPLQSHLPDLFDFGFVRQRGGSFVSRKRHSIVRRINYRGGLCPIQILCRKQPRPQSMNDRMMKQLEQQQIAAEAETAAISQDESGSEPTKQEDAIPDLVEDNNKYKDRRHSWYMVKHYRGGPKKGEK